MELSKDIIKRLKDLGFTQEDIVELDRLSYVYDQNDLYKKIGSMNNAMLETDIRPVNINIDNIEKRLTHDKKASPKIILDEYKREERVANGGITGALEDYYRDLANELSYYGINATPEQLYELYSTSPIHSKMLDKIIIWFRRYIDLLESGGGGEYINQAVENMNLANEIVSWYSGVDLDTGEVL